MSERPLPPSSDDRSLDEAISALRSQGPTPGEAEAALRRAREALAAVAASEAGCTAFANDVEALVAGTLPAGRAALHGAHASECADCRRKASRVRAAAGAPESLAAFEAALVADPDRRGRGRYGWRIGLPIAATVAGLAAATVLLVGRPAGDDQAGARVADVQGQVFLVEAHQDALAAGASVPDGAVVRTARESRATLELADGSRIELNERTEVSVDADAEGTAVRLVRGDVIVAAAQRRERNLFVDTADCRIAVKGTIFAVEHGLKGSRVGVLEGEVHVDDRRATHVLRPGQQVTTRETLAPRDLAEQVRWSGSAASYAELVNGLDALARSLQEQPLARNVRHSSELLPALPVDTVAYAALPNTPGNFSRISQLVREQLDASPELRAALQADARSGHPSLDELLDDLERLATAVGDEVVLALVLDTSGGSAAPVPAPVLLAATRDAKAVQAALAGLEPRGEVETWDRQRLRAEALVARRPDGRLRVIVGGGHVVATSSVAVAERLFRSLEAPGTARPRGSDFFETIEEQYRAGTELVMAVDLERLVANALSHAPAGAPADPAAEAFQAAAKNLRHFVATSGESEDRATLTFKESRSGLASWLAEPAPMGGLQFVTPQASAVLSVVVKDPEMLVADLRRAIGEVHIAQGLRSFQDRTGLDLLADVAAPLGGEVTLALDGPLLPRPSWKLVVEVYDPKRLTSSLERAVQRARDEAAAAGRPGPSLETIQVLGAPGFVLRDPSLAGEICWAYRDGYLVACPGRALLEAALQAQQLGASFLTSPALAQRLPKDADGDLSLLAWQDLGPQLSPWLERLGVANAGGGLGDSALLVQGRATEREVTFTLASSEAGPGARLASLLRHAALRALLAELAEGPAEPKTAPGTSL